MDMKKALFTIRIAAETTGLHPQTIRVYEQKGLICPARSDGGTRMYSIEDIELIEEIHSLSDAGVGIEGISMILSMRQQIAELEHQVEALSQENAQLVSKTTKTAIVVRSSSYSDADAADKENEND